MKNIWYWLTGRGRHDHLARERNDDCCRYHEPVNRLARERKRYAEQTAYRFVDWSKVDVGEKE